MVFWRKSQVDTTRQPPTSSLAPAADMAGSARGEMLLNIPKVQLHKVSNGREELLEEGPFHVYLAPTGDPPAVFAQVGGATWQFLHNMPTLKAADQAYMFAMSDNIFYSVLLAPGTARDDQHMLEMLLAECTALQTGQALSEQEKTELSSQVEEELMEPGATDPSVPLDPSEQQEEIPPGRIAGASASIQGKISSGASWASSKILDLSQQMQERYPPNETPTNISDANKARIKTARHAAHRTAVGAAAIVGGLSDVTMKVADRMIRTFGRTSDAEALASTEQKKKRGAAKNVAASSVLAALEIYDSMESAALLVLKSSGDASSGFIGHRYGPDAGEAARDVSATVVSGGKAVRSASQLRNLGVRPIATRIARRTAKGVVKSWVKPVPKGQAGSASGAASVAASGPAGATTGVPSATNATNYAPR